MRKTKQKQAQNNQQQLAILPRKIQTLSLIADNLENELRDFVKNIPKKPPNDAQTNMLLWLVDMSQSNFVDIKKNEENATKLAEKIIDLYQRTIEQLNQSSNVKNITFIRIFSFCGHAIYLLNAYVKEKNSNYVHYCRQALDVYKAYNSKPLEEINFEFNIFSAFCHVINHSLSLLKTKKIQTSKTINLEKEIKLYLIDLEKFTNNIKNSELRCQSYLYLAELYSTLDVYETFSKAVKFQDVAEAERICNAYEQYDEKIADAIIKESLSFLKEHLLFRIRVMKLIEIELKKSAKEIPIEALFRSKDNKVSQQEIQTIAATATDYLRKEASNIMDTKLNTKEYALRLASNFYSIYCKHRIEQGINTLDQLTKGKHFSENKQHYASGVLLNDIDFAVRMLNLYLDSLKMIFSQIKQSINYFDFNEIVRQGRAHPEWQTLYNLLYVQKQLCKNINKIYSVLGRFEEKFEAHDALSKINIINTPNGQMLVSDPKHQLGNLPQQLGKVVNNPELSENEHKIQIKLNILDKQQADFEKNLQTREENFNKYLAELSEHEKTKQSYLQFKLRCKKLTRDESSNFTHASQETEAVKQNQASNNTLLTDMYALYLKGEFQQAIDLALTNSNKLDTVMEVKIDYAIGEYYRAWANTAKQLNKPEVIIIELSAKSEQYYQQAFSKSKSVLENINQNSTQYVEIKAILEFLKARISIDESTAEDINLEKSLLLREQERDSKTSTSENYKKEFMYQKKEIPCDFTINDNQKYALDKLSQFGKQAYAVGGFVRDKMQNKKPNDFDIVTTASNEEVLKLFPGQSKLVSFRFPIILIKFNDEVIQVVNCDNMDNDYLRRDFSFNMFHYDYSHKKVIDYCDGKKDLDDGIVRMPFAPEEQCQEDPIRILRGYRFAAKFGFNFDKQTRQAMKKMAKLITSVNADRLFLELKKIFLEGYGLAAFQLLQIDGILKYLMPQTAEYLTKSHKLFDIMLKGIFQLQDSRKQQQVSTSAGLLLAVLLWGPLTKKLETINTLQDHEWTAKWNDTVQQVIDEQSVITHIPDAISLKIKMIWRFYMYENSKRPIEIIDDFSYNEFVLYFHFNNLINDANKTFMASMANNTNSSTLGNSISNAINPSEKSRNIINKTEEIFISDSEASLENLKR